MWRGTGLCRGDSQEVAQSHQSLHYDQHKLMQLGQWHAMVLKRTKKMQPVSVPVSVPKQHDDVAVGATR